LFSEKWRIVLPYEPAQSKAISTRERMIFLAEWWGGGSVHVLSLDGGEEIQAIKHTQLGHGGDDWILGVRFTEDGQLVLVTGWPYYPLTLRAYQVSCDVTSLSQF
jgi:hypothetical protein